MTLKHKSTAGGMSHSAVGGVGGGLTKWVMDEAVMMCVQTIIPTLRCYNIICVWGGGISRWKVISTVSSA